MPDARISDELRTALRELAWCRGEAEEAAWVRRVTPVAADLPADFLTPASVSAATTAIGMSPAVGAVLIAAASALRDSPGRRCLAWWCHLQLGGCEAGAPLPTFPVAATSDAGLLQALVVVSLRRQVQARDAARRVPPAVTLATFADLERWMRDCRDRTGQWGFREMNWLVGHLVGELYELGRLQFKFGILADRFVARRNDATGEIRLFSTDAIASAAERPWRDLVRPGDRVLEVHVPAGAPLDPAACDEAFRTAAHFFRAHFSGRPYRAFTCHSWLLDPQLAAYLPAETNVVSFQRRFRLFPVSAGNHRQIFERVFGAVDVDPALAPRDTLLRRIVLEHVAAGGTWQLGGGLIPVTPEA